MYLETELINVGQTVQLTYEALRPEQKIVYNFLVKFIGTKPEDALRFIATTSQPFTSIWREARRLGVTDWIIQQALKLGVNPKIFTGGAPLSDEEEKKKDDFSKYLPWIIGGGFALAGIFFLTKAVKK